MIPDSAGPTSPLPTKPRVATLPRWVLILCATLWLAVGLFGRQPYKPDEAYTVGLVKSIVDSGDWVVPRLTGEPFMEKPPLFFVVAAGFAKGLWWLPLHEAARLAVVVFVAIGLAAIAASARAIHGAGSGRLAAILTLATVGTVVRMHQLITDTGLFAGIAVALLGLIEAPRRPRIGGLLLGAGLAVSFLSKGLLGPGLIVFTTLVLLCMPPWRQPSFARTLSIAALVAMPLAACWLVPLALRAPDQLHVWFYDNNLGRFLGSNNLGPKKDIFFYGRTLMWYAQPCLSLALWGWVRNARNERPDEELLKAAPPLALLAVGIAVLTLASDGRELYALVLVPAMSVAAVGGLKAVPVHVERRIAIAAAALFLLPAAALLAFWALAMRTPALTAMLPSDVAMPEMVAPSPAAMVLYAVVAPTLVMMLALLRRPVRGALPLAGAAGVALLWASLVLPWGAYLDALKGYREVARSLGEHLPNTACVASSGLGEGERALLDYYIGLRVRRAEDPASQANECNALLVQSLASQPAEMRPPWRLRWTGARRGRDSSVFRLYLRQLR
jgi:4-amino-4-deoxy-L-arabinose transferase-like glycosyltransferase